MSFSLSNDGFIYLPTSNQLGDIQSTSRPILAIKVSFDPMGTTLQSTDVQSAIEELFLAITAIPLAERMRPTTLGLAYGNQEETGRKSNYGIDVSEASNSITFFNKHYSTSSPQSTVPSNSIVHQNVCMDPVGTPMTITFSSCKFNLTPFISSAVARSVIDVTSSMLTGAIVESILEATQTNIPALQRSTFRATNCLKMANSYTNSVINAHSQNVAFNGDVTNSIYEGDMTGVTTNVSNAGVVRTSSLNPLVPAPGSFFIGNGNAQGTLTQEAGEFRFGSYSKFKFDTIPMRSTTSLCFYDTSTKEIVREDLNPALPDRLTQFLARNPTTGKYFAVNAANTFTNRVTRRQATTDASGYVTVDVSAFSFVDTAAYDIICTVSGAPSGRIYSFTVAKTSTTATILLENLISGSNVVLAAPGVPFSYLIAY